MEEEILFVKEGRINLVGTLDQCMYEIQSRIDFNISFEAAIMWGRSLRRNNNDEIT
jgi:hypothetical protein